MPYIFAQKYTYWKTSFERVEWKMEFLDLVWQSFHFQLKSLYSLSMNFLNQTRFEHPRSRNALPVYNLRIKLCLLTKKFCSTCFHYSKLRKTLCAQLLRLIASLDWISNKTPPSVELVMLLAITTEVVLDKPNDLVQCPIR